MSASSASRAEKCTKHERICALAGVALLTEAGCAARDQLIAARCEELRELLAEWSPEQHAELAALLSQMARRLVGAEPDVRVFDAGKPSREAHPEASGERAVRS